MTPRESQTLPLIRQALTNKEIAKNMGISEKTVERYVSDCIAAFGARNKTDLAIKLATAEDPRDYL